MSLKRYDAIVAGLGAMGSATAANLALRGKRVLGLDRWWPGHPFGSSHGDSRIIREMYFEHPMYVPLLQRAYELWAVLGERVDETLLHVHGGLMIGPAGGMLVEGTLRSAAEHDLPHEVLKGGDVAKRYPAFEIREDLVAVRDPRAGWLDPERCNAAHLKVAAANGAELRFEEPVLSWEASGEGVEIRTSLGSYAADNLVVSAGARVKDLLPDLEIPLEIERQAVFWFDPPDRGSDFSGKNFPIYAYEYTPGAICYGFPRLDRGVKASVMHGGKISPAADAISRAVEGREIDALRHALEPVLPRLARAEVTESTTCIFTNTPDHDFVIDFHPAFPQVLISSACSGHGFKFASVIGELQADLVIEGNTRLDISPFRLSRLSAGR